MALKDLIREKMMKGDNKMSDLRKKAKSNIIDELEEMADQGMGKNLKQVTVSSDSKEGLEKGLDMAEETISGDDEGGSLDEALEDAEMSDDGTGEDADLEDMMDGAKMSERDKYDEEEYGEDYEDSMSESNYDDMSEEELEEEIRKLEAMKAKMG